MCNDSVYFQMYTVILRKLVRQNRTRQCRKVLRVHGTDWSFRCFSDTEGNSTNKWINILIFFCWLTLWTSFNQRETFLLIIPIGVARALLRCWGTTTYTKKLAFIVRVTQASQNVVISSPCFVEDSKEMYKIYKARAQLLFCSLNLLFGGVLVTVTYYHRKESLPCQRRLTKS